MKQITVQQAAIFRHNRGVSLFWGRAMFCQPCHAYPEAPRGKGDVRHGAFEQTKAPAGTGAVTPIPPRTKSREKVLNQFPLLFGVICALAMLLLGSLWAVVRQPQEARLPPETMSAPGLFTAPPKLGTPGAVPPPADLMSAPASLVPAPALSSVPAENNLTPAPASASAPETATPAAGREDAPPQGKDHRAAHAADPAANTAAAKPQPKPARAARKSSPARQNKAPGKSLEWIESLRWLS